MTVVCPQCHTENQAGDRFCQECGSPLPTPAEQPQVEPDPVPQLNGGAPLLIRLGADGGEEFKLQRSATVGRLDSCDLAIHDSSVSRQHAQITLVDGGYRIQDLGSTNGTMINGTRISSPRMLQRGDIVTFGSVEFRYEAPADVASRSTQPPQAASSPSASADDAIDGAIFTGSLPPATAAPEPALAREPEQPMHEAGAPPVPDVQPIPEEAADVPPEPIPQPSLQAEESDDPVQLAHRLAQLVEDLTARASSAEREATETRERLQRLEDARDAQAAVRRAIESAPSTSMSEDQLASVENMLTSLVASPRDIDALMNISREAAALAGVVHEYSQMRSVLREVAGAVGTSLRQ